MPKINYLKHTNLLKKVLTFLSRFSYPN